MDVERYRTLKLTDDEIREGVHRQRVGGKWKKIGRHQFEFMVAQGLQPQHRLLDVGCGALRGGIHFIRYLAPSRYYGVDINASLIRAGYDFELDDELRAKVPPDHLRVTALFDCDFGVAFDFALAQSVFTHTPLNHMRLCLWQVSRRMRPGGHFYCTFNEAPAEAELDEYNYTKNPYQYRPSDLVWAADGRWDVEYIGDWGHPRNQHMMCFTLR
jgi:SAM-dependent methyltransferase